MRVARRIVPAFYPLLFIAALASLSGCAMKIPSLAALEAPANSSEPTEPALHLSDFHDIVGTPYRFAVAGDDSHGKLSSFASAGGSIRNWIILDTRTLRSRRLFDTNRNVILDSKQLAFAENERRRQEQIAPLTTPMPPAATKWLYFEVVDQDTNRDGRLNSADGFTVAFTDASGVNYYPAIPTVTRVLGTTMTSDDEAVVAYMTEGKTYAARIDLAARTVMAAEPLALTTTTKEPANNSAASEKESATGR